MKKIGIVFGGYCPLHQGHMDVIMRAKKENDLTYVFVCGYDNDRGGEMLPLMKRYRIISNFLKDDTVKVDYINDTELGLDESMSAENWKIWCGAIYEKVFNSDPTIDPYDEDKNEFNWYCSELSYIVPIYNASDGVCNVRVILMDRTKNPVSGTLCRTHPLTYWHKITAPFRAYYSHNILIAGTASEGKSTLTRDIGKYFNLPYSYEKGRDICALKADPEFTFKDFVYNIYEQHKYNEELIASPQNPGIFISDTDNMVTLMYAYFYAQRPGFAINMEEYNILYSLVEEYVKTTKWDKIFLLKPKEKGIVNDGERYMPDSDYKIRCEFYEYLKYLYTTFGYSYEELDGDYYENYCAVRDYIREVKGKEF